MNFKQWLLAEDLSPEQNIIIKQIYIIIRDILLDIKNQMLKNGFNDFSDPNKFIKFWLNFRKIYELHKNVKGWKGSKLEIILPENVSNILPNLITPFYISFPFEDDEMGGLVIYNGAWAGEKEGKTDELRVSLKHLLDFENYKPIIQHELQHIVDIGTDLDHGQSNPLLKVVSYMCNKGEIQAHAKEYAYKYYKKFPSDISLDFNKFKQTFYKKDRKGGADNYIRIGEEIPDLRSKYLFSSEDEKVMTTCYNNFKNTLERSFFYFKQNSAQ